LNPLVLISDHLPQLQLIHASLSCVDRYFCRVSLLITELDYVDILKLGTTAKSLPRRFVQDHFHFPLGIHCLLQQLVDIHPSCAFWPSIIKIPECCRKL